MACRRAPVYSQSREFRDIYGVFIVREQPIRVGPELVLTVDLYRILCS